MAETYISFPVEDNDLKHIFLIKGQYLVKTQLILE